MKKNFIKATLALLLLTCLFFTAAIFSGATSEETPELNITQCSLSLRDSICIKYAVEANVNDVVMLVWTEPQSEYVVGTEDDVITEYTIENIGGVPYKVFAYTKLAAKQMTDVIYVRAYASSGSADSYSEITKYSILQYAYNKLGKTGVATTDENLKALLSEMLEYGAAAQKYLNNYKVDRLATADWYQIKVTGGLLDDGCDNGLYLPGDTVTITAPEDDVDVGVRFSHWENSNGESVSTDRSYTFTVEDTNEHYSAVTKPITPDIPDTPEEEESPFNPTQTPVVTLPGGTWYLDDVPMYIDGIFSDASYLAGGGLDPTLPVSNENVMQAVRDTTATDFAAYLKKLTKNGYTQEFYRTADSNVFASYVKDNIRVYAYYMSHVGEARIIREYVSNSTPISDFGYTYTKKSGDQTVLYQYGVPMTDENHLTGHKNNGMIYVLKLADNSVVIIDGANEIQLKNQTDSFMSFLRDITNTPSDGTVRIAAWYITHAHSDHYLGFRKFVQEYSSYLDLERICFAFPSLNSPFEPLSSGSGVDGYKNINNLVNNYFGDDDTVFMRLHTGQQFNLADVTFEVLYTHEDAVSAISGESQILDYNSSSSIIRITVDGETFMILGDAGRASMRSIIRGWSADYLKTDGIQLAHHAMNDIRDLYDIVKAEAVFVPQSPYGIAQQALREEIIEAVKAYARDDMLFYASMSTVGISVSNGKWEKADERALVG